MKTSSVLLGASLLFAVSLARAEEPLPAPVVGAPAAVYSVPAWAPPAPAASGPGAGYFAVTRRRSTALMISGIALASLGTASLLGGAVMLDQASHGPASCSDLCFSRLDSELQRTSGTLLTVNGGLMVAGGVAMAIAGGWQVPVAGSGATGASTKILGAPRVAVGPGTATVRWSF